MLQPQLLQVLLGNIRVIFLSVTSAVSIIMGSAEICIAPVAIGRVTQQGIAKPTLPRINNKETATTTTTTPTIAAITQGQAPSAMDVERLGISVETAPTPTTLGTEKQEGC